MNGFGYTSVQNVGCSIIILGVRVGYTALTASDKFSAGQWTQGISFQNSTGQLDYAHVRGGAIDGSLHWVSATLRWGGSQRQSTAAPITETTADSKHKDVPETEASRPILMPKTLEADTGADVTTEDLQLSNVAISPNSDGVADSTTFRFKVKASDKWRLTLRDAYTEEVWVKTGTGSPPEGVVWDGMGASGKLVPDGDYVLQLHILDTKGNAHLKHSKKVTVDLIPTTLEMSKKGSTSVGVKAWDINAITDWKLEIYDAADTLVEKNEGSGSPPETVVLKKVPQLTTATYRFVLSVKDIAGNQSVQQTQLQFGGNSAGTETQVVTEEPKLTLMVGSFGERRYADMLAENLQRMYPDEEVKIYTVVVDGNTRHRVTIGTFTERSEASALKQQIHESQGEEPVLITP